MPVRRPCCLQHERLEQIRMPRLVFCTLLGPEGPGSFARRVALTRRQSQRSSSDLWTLL